MNLMKHIIRGQQRVEREWLPDRCTIETVSETPVVNPDGSMSRATELRTYKGSTDIPCRVESSRSFRPERLPNQEINVNEYVLHVPVDVAIKPNDKITIQGRVFEVRKQTNITSWRLTNEALIVELEGQYG